MRKFIQSFLGLLLMLPIIGFGQTCPNYQKRNNGNGSANCSLSDPSNYGIYNQKTGHFTFSSGDWDFSVEKVYYNSVLIQDGNTLMNSNTVFFGYIRKYMQGQTPQSDMCFYATSSSGGVAPAGNFNFVIKNGSTTITCSYAISGQNGAGLSTTTAGTIGSDQTICSATTPNSLTSATNATNYTSYKWRSSTTSSTSGFSDISGETSSTYSPPALTQTTYYQRIAVSADGEFASNTVTITVLNSGTISPQPGSTWTGSSTTFTTTGSGGTWSVATTPSGIATISSGGLLTATATGSGTVTYTVTSGATTCTSTRTFNIYSNGVTFPVTWETVTAEKINGQSLLKWSTASEQNTKDFEVQYSTNTNTWEALGTVPAAGNSSTTRNYSYTHQNPLKGNNYNYYRILQRDLDGKFSYSKIVSVLFGEPGSDIILYPNPADDVVTVFLAEAQEITLLNAAGAVVLRSKMPGGKSTLSIEKYSPGVYILRTKSKSLRFVIQ